MDLEKMRERIRTQRTREQLWGDEPPASIARDLQGLRTHKDFEVDKSVDDLDSTRKELYALTAYCIERVYPKLQGILDAGPPDKIPVDLSVDRAK